MSQRLPKGDHVANFSTLLADDLKAHSTGNMPRSVSGSNLEGLFGNMDELLEEGQMFIGSEGLDCGILTTRSMSDGSLSSLPSPNDYTSDDHASQHSAGSHVAPDRRFRHFVTSEDCTDDHPLSLPSEDENTLTTRPSSTSPPPTLRVLAGKSDKKPRQSLTSSLSASLKALKSAAQSVSHRNPTPPSDARPKSIFDFHPSLTDDRRPPPSLESPNAELRRYLSPPPLDSAAQLHFWQDHRHSKFDTPPHAPQTERESRRRSPKGKRGLSARSPSPPGSNPRIAELPAIVPLASCLPPSIRTEHASSPPIWLTQDGTPVNKNTAIPLLYDPDANDGKGEPVGVRHREPRENRDFLRVFVCEMHMRRNGKLSDDLGAGRARLWLPPVTEKDKTSSTKSRKEGEQIVAPVPVLLNKKRSARERLVCMSAGDV